MVTPTQLVFIGLSAAIKHLDIRCLETSSPLKRFALIYSNQSVQDEIIQCTRPTIHCKAYFSFQVQSCAMRVLRQSQRCVRLSIKYHPMHTQTNAYIIKISFQPYGEKGV